MTKQLLPLALGLLSLSLSVATSQSQLDTISVGAVKPSASITRECEATGKKNSLMRMVESLDLQLLDSLSRTGKFQIVARSDLKEIHKEQDLATTGNVETDSPSAPRQLKLAGAKYLLVTSLDDFQDFTETATFTDTGRSATKRTIRVSAVGKIYATTTGKLLESANFQLSSKDLSENRSYSVKDGELSDALIASLARVVSAKISGRVIDVIYPAKVIALSAKQVTLNRGDGTGIATGQIWNVMALGQELIDPDTKESLGRQETLIGKVKITTVLPKTSTAEVLQDNGITVGAILRQAQQNAGN